MSTKPSQIGEILRSASPVCLVGGGEATAADLRDCLRLASHLVAADGGAALALEAGHVPDAVIGDFDSLQTRHRAQIPAERLHHIPEQDSTDFDKALGRIAAPVVLGAGFLGARVDHQLAAFSTLLRFAHRPCVLLGPDEIVFHAPPSLALDLVAGAVVSLFPLQPVQGRSEGLEWPIDGLHLSPEGRIGTSNRAKGAIRLWVDGPGLLVILPRGALAPVTQALSSGSSWPPGGQTA